MFSKRNSALHNNSTQWTLTDFCSYLSLDSIPDNTEISREQFEEITTKVETIGFYTLSADKNIRVDIRSFIGGILVIKRNKAEDRITISVKSSYQEAINATNAFIRSINKFDRRLFNVN